MADAKKDTPPAEEFEIVETPVKYEAEPDRDGKIAQEAADDDDGDEDAGGQEDQRLDAESVQESPQTRDRRSQRQKAKERRLAAQERDQATIAGLIEQNRLLAERQAQLEAGQTNSQVQQITGRMDQLSASYNGLKEKKAEAIRLGDGAASVRLDEEMGRLTSEWHDLNNKKKQMTPTLADQAKQAQQTQQVQQPVAAERIKGLANEFLKRHTWIDPKGEDDDSVVVREIDQELMQEGLIPSTRAFWNEFDERLKEALPHRFRTGRRTSPPISSSREHVPNSTRTQVYVSKERRQAMEEAGTWDDPVERKKQLAYYAKYDRENAVSR